MVVFYIGLLKQFVGLTKPYPCIIMLNEITRPAYIWQWCFVFNFELFFGHGVTFSPISATISWTSGFLVTFTVGNEVTISYQIPSFFLF